MFSKEGLLDLASNLASSATEIALKSFGQREAIWPHDHLSGQRRPRLKRFIERFFCFQEENMTSSPPASIGEPAEGHYSKDLFVDFAKWCRSWLKRQYISRRAKGKGSLSTFHHVINNMKLSTLPAYASSLRRSRAGAGLDKTSAFHCTLECSPMVGSYNILFPVIFRDGVKWLFKIPATGYIGCWDSSAAQALRSEALTMQMLQQKTSIPIPKVYSFDTSLDNDFKVPFILMEHIDGEPLYQKWYNGFTSVDAQEKFREQALQDLAAATVQLSAFKYSQAGSPSFDENGELQGIEPVRVVDTPATHSRSIERCFGDDTYCELGPYSNATDYFRSMLDKHRISKDTYTQGVYQVLHLFLDWIPKEVPIENEAFVMVHPDLNLQNVLVAEDGTLRGLIDWDGVSTVPRSVGCVFPKWLAFDWDPAKYTYGMDLGSKSRLRQHSPTEMKHYRALYARFIAESVTKYKAQDDNIPLELADITRRSIVIDSVNQAAKNPFSITHNVFNILDKIGHITSQTYFKSYCETYEGTIAGGQSIILADHSLRIESVTQAEGDFSADGSSEDISDSDFSETSTVTRDSTELSELFSEQEEQQAVTIQVSDPLPSNEEEQRILDQDLTTNIDERGIDSTKETISWRRVPSLLQNASRQLRARVKRIKISKSRRLGSSGVSVSLLDVQTNTSKTNATTSAGHSSKAIEIIQPKPCSDSLTPITHDEASNKNDGTISVAASGHLSSGTTVIQENKQSRTYQSYTDTQCCLSIDADGDQSHVPVSSTEQQNAPSGSMRTHEEHDDDSLPSNSLSATSERRKDTFGRRLKARLAKSHSQKGNGVRASSPTLSADSEDSRRKRILGWIRKTSQKPLSTEEDSESSWNSDSTLPEIDHVSLFDIPCLNEAGFKTNDDKHDMNDTGGEGSTTMTKLVTAYAAKLPPYDAGEPVEREKLANEKFTTADICIDLAEEKFDEARMRRLQVGFAALLDSL